MRLFLPSRSADHASATKRKHAFILVERRRPRHAPAGAQPESMADDLGLLLDPLARQRPAGMERIAVAAERMPGDRDRKRGVWVKSGSGRVGDGGGRRIKKKR